MIKSVLLIWCPDLWPALPSLSLSLRLFLFICTHSILVHVNDDGRLRGKKIEKCKVNELSKRLADYFITHSDGAVQTRFISLVFFGFHQYIAYVYQCTDLPISFSRIHVGRYPVWKKDLSRPLFNCPINMFLVSCHDKKPTNNPLKIRIFQHTFISAQHQFYYSVQ